MVTSGTSGGRGRRSPRSCGPRLLRVRLGGFAALGALEVGGDRLGLGAAAARTATALVVLVACGLAAPLGAVCRLPFLALVGLLARRGLAARLGDRVGDGVGDQLYRADRVVIAGDR